MPAADITTDILIINAALAGLGIDPIGAFSDTTTQGVLANATYRLHLEQVLVGHPWNFALKHFTLDMAIPPTPAWTWDFAYTMPTDALRIWEVEDQSANVEDEWTISDDLLLSNLAQGKQALFGPVAALSLTIPAHGFTAGDAVIVIDVDDLPTGLVEDRVYYVLVVDVNTIQLALTSGGANILLTNDGGDGNTIIRRTIDIRSIQYITDVTKYSAQFITTLVAKLESEWAEPLVKATTLGERKDQKFMDKLTDSRSMDGQEGTPLRLDTSTWIDSR